MTHTTFNQGFLILSENMYFGFFKILITTTLQLFCIYVIRRGVERSYYLSQKNFTNEAVGLCQLIVIVICWESIREEQAESVKYGNVSLSGSLNKIFERKMSNRIGMEGKGDSRKIFYALHECVSRFIR